MSKIKDYLLAKYEEGEICDECGETHDEENKVMTIKEKEICLACSQSYPPNGILFCDDCGMDKDMEQQKEREGDDA